MPLPPATGRFGRATSASCASKSARRRAPKSVDAIRRSLLDRAEPAVELETHPPVVVRALPLAHLRFVGRRRRRARVPEPFAVLAIHDVPVEEVPRPLGRVEERVATSELPRVHEADDGLRPHPPRLLVVDDLAVLGLV